jgi:hypothetical protein
MEDVIHGIHPYPESATDIALNLGMLCMEAVRRSSTIVRRSFTRPAILRMRDLSEVDVIQHTDRRIRRRDCTAPAVWCRNVQQPGRVAYVTDARNALALGRSPDHRVWSAGPYDGDKRLARRIDGRVSRGSRQFEMTKSISEISHAFELDAGLTLRRAYAAPLAKN